MALVDAGRAATRSSHPAGHARHDVIQGAPQGAEQGARLHQEQAGQPVTSAGHDSPHCHHQHRIQVRHGLGLTTTFD